MSRNSSRFVSALLLDGNGGARKLSDADVDNWTEGDGILWVDIDLASKSGKSWLKNGANVGREVTSILLAGATRPRSVTLEDCLVVIMRGINMNPGAVPDDMVAVRLAIANNLIISTRRRKILSVNDLRDALQGGEGPRTVGAFLVRLADTLSERIESAVDNIEGLITQIDDTMSGGDVSQIRVSLGIVRRQAAAIRRYLAPQRDAVERIARSHGGVLSEPEAFELREAGDELTRHIEDLDLARENALVTQEELMNRVALEQNARMYLLSVVAAIFLPLTFVTGLLGMNVAGLPGIDNPNGFLYSLLIMIGCLAGLVVYFRWRKWL